MDKPLRTSSPHPHPHLHRTHKFIAREPRKYRQRQAPPPPFFCTLLLHLRRHICTPVVVEHARNHIHGYPTCRRHMHAAPACALMSERILHARPKFEPSRKNAVREGGAVRAQAPLHA